MAESTYFIFKFSLAWLERRELPSDSSLNQYVEYSMASNILLEACCYLLPDSTIDKGLNKAMECSSHCRALAVEISAIATTRTLSSRTADRLLQLFHLKSLSSCISQKCEKFDRNE